MNNFDEYKVLETVNQWIFNCDTKASIILAAYGAGASIVGSSEIGRAVVNMFKLNITSKSLCSIMFVGMLLASIFLFLYGLFNLIFAISPRIHSNVDSVMFFGKVATYTDFESYKNAVNVCNRDNKVVEDLLKQIFEASKICNEKFKCYKKGLRYSLTGMFIMLLWLIIGFFTYYV